MSSSYTEPDWSSESDPRDDSREPFFWFFVLLAVVVGVIAVTGSRGNATDATFALSDQTIAVPGSEATPVPLPTAAPTEVPEEIPVAVEVTYNVDTIKLDGSVPAQAVADALISAAVALVGADSVEVGLEIDESSSLAGGVIVLSGEIDEESDRGPIVAGFANVGLEVDDRLIIAGSDSTIAEILTANSDLQQITDFLSAAGLLAELGAESEAGLTLFAPTNAAVESLDSIVFDELSDADKLTEVLQYHIVSGSVRSRELASVTALTSLQGESISVSGANDGFIVGGARITVADIDANNGVVHVIDAVLLPGTLRTEVALNQLVTLDPVLFAPSSAEILDESLPSLDQAAQLLLENPLGRVEIQGHTDTDGPAEVNLDLSQRRAEAVRDYLVGAGVGTARLNPRGYGETQLQIDPEESGDDKAANRRIEFRVT